jgi:hypothetical protein
MVVAGMPFELQSVTLQAIDVQASLALQKRSAPQLKPLGHSRFGPHLGWSKFGLKHAVVASIAIVITPEKRFDMM